MKKFIQDSLYVEKDEHGEVTKTVLYYPENLEANTTYSVLLFSPSNIEERKKESLQCSIKLTASICERISVNAKEYGGTANEDNISLEAAYFLKDLSRFLGYMNNCQSFYSEKIEDFDKEELKKRLQKLINTL